MQIHHSIRQLVFMMMLSLLASTVSADEFSTHKLSVAGKTRTYHIHKGKSVGRPLPLVVVLHGGGANGEALRNTYGFKPIIDAGECIAIYPAAEKGQWLPDDTSFVDAAIDDVLSREPIDQSRLFVTGASSGGLMTFIMASKSKHKFRAAGTVIATQMKSLADEYPIKRPIDFAMIAGTDDPLMLYLGGRVAQEPRSTSDPDDRLLPVEDVIQSLLKINSISGQPKISSLRDTDPNDGCTNEVRLWSDGGSGRRVMLVKVVGGGHVVPGGRQYLPKSRIGAVCNDFNHVKVMWNFFKGAVASNSTSTAKTPSKPVDNKAAEKDLRARASALFAAIRAGDIDKCMTMSDPSSVAKHGRDKARRFFKTISFFARLARVKSNDHRITSVAIAKDGRSARVQTQVRLRSSWRPPETELWALVKGQWLYQETVKK